VLGYKHVPTNDVGRIHCVRGIAVDKVSDGVVADFGTRRYRVGLAVSQARRVPLHAHSQTAARRFPLL